MEENNTSNRIIKKYANRKLYDTTEKKYISLDRLAELIKAGEEVSIIDNENSDDITASVVSQLLAREKKENGQGDDASSGVLIQLLRKSGGRVADYAKRYVSLWQNALTMAEDEVDKLVNLLVKDKEISESEGSKLKKELTGYADNFKNWVSNKIDHRVNEVLGAMNLATKEQVVLITDKMEKLTQAVEKLEQMQARQEQYQAQIQDQMQESEKAPAETEEHA